MVDGDGINVYVSTADPRESSFVPGSVHEAAVQRSEARDRRNYAEADAFHKQIIDSGYRLVFSSRLKIFSYVNCTLFGYVHVLTINF